MHRFRFFVFAVLLLAVATFAWQGDQTGAQGPPDGKQNGQGLNYHGKVTPAEREAAAERFKATKAAAEQAPLAGVATTAALVPDPNTGYLIPDYFGDANWAYSPLPSGGVSVALGNGGTGYSAPVVTITDAYGLGTGATATAAVAGGVITGISVNTPGSGYYAPVVSISDATGTGATATATLDPAYPHRRHTEVHGCAAGPGIQRGKPARAVHSDCCAGHNDVSELRRTTKSPWSSTRSRCTPTSPLRHTAATCNWRHPLSAGIMFP